MLLHYKNILTVECRGSSQAFVFAVSEHQNQGGIQNCEDCIWDDLSTFLFSYFC
jgi:hypothetical protein